MRRDEEFAKHAVVAFLRGKGVAADIQPGADAPDYEVLMDADRIALEVTRAEPLFLREGDLDNRRTIDQSLCRLCDQLNDRFGVQIPEGVSLLLHLEGPFENFGSFADS
jgi:hypothetical protein